MYQIKTVHVNIKSGLIMRIQRMAVLWGVSHSIFIGSEMEQCQTQKNGLRLDDNCNETRKFLTLHFKE